MARTSKAKPKKAVAKTAPSKKGVVAKPAKPKQPRAEKSAIKKSPAASPLLPASKQPSPTTTPEVESHGLYIVGIGSSAGGLEALTALLRSLPINANISYVIAQHLDPKHKSLLVTLLARETAIEVKAAEHNEKLKHNCIYVCPANKDVTVINGTLKLKEPRHAIGPKPSVDLFLSSLAEDVGEKAIGVILSGTGSDGAHGIRAIKAAGGITIAQDQASAKYNGMPSAAVSTGAVDFVLPPERIAQELPSITAFPRRLLSIQPTGKALSAYDRIMMLIKKRTEVDFSEYKASTVMRRIMRRLAAHRIDTIEDYALMLEGSPEECEDLCRDITISVTSFFRDKEAFKALGKVVAQIVAEKKDGEPIRIWVPGCATGEEVYSIAILVAEELGGDITRRQVQIFGTDLDTDATIAARRGVYSEVAVENLDDALLSRWFVRMGNTYQVAKALREMTVFARQNLIKDPPFLRIDLVSCRNLLIYFTPALQKRVFELFHYVLRPGGALFLGKSESVGQFANLFDQVNRKWRIFKRKGTPKFVPGNYAAGFRVSDQPPAREREREQEREPSLTDMMYQVLLSVFAPPSVIVDEKQEVQHIHLDCSPFLRLAPGKAALNLLNLARDELRPSLRALMHKAFRENATLTGQRLKLKIGGESRYLSLSVHPFSTSGSAPTHAVVSFSFLSSDHSDFSAMNGDTAPEMDDRISELEQELAATREHLQTVIEELETSNEELQSLNEELQASNEELQSSNEELETSNEELQSTNEELITVNEELQVKTNELAEVNTDLENLQNSIGFPLVVVDKDLRITRFTPQAVKIFAVLSSDIGQIITSVPCNFDIAGLRATLLKVIANAEIYEHDIDGGSVVYRMKLFPYYSEHREVAGAVMVFLDKTAIHRADAKLKDEEGRFSMVSKVAKLASWDWDVASGVFERSVEVEPLFGMQPGEFKRTYQSFLDAVHPDDRALVTQAIDAALFEDKPYDIEHRIIWPDGSLHWVRESGMVVRDQLGRPSRMVGIVVSTDDRHRIAAFSQREEALLGMIDGMAALLDAQGTILAGNRPFFERFGSPEALRGKICAAVISCLDCDGDVLPTCPLHDPGSIILQEDKDHVLLATRHGEARIYPLPSPNTPGKTEKFVLHIPAPRFS